MEEEVASCIEELSSLVDSDSEAGAEGSGSLISGTS